MFARDSARHCTNSCIFLCIDRSLRPSARSLKGQNRSAQYAHPVGGYKYERQAELSEHFGRPCLLRSQPRAALDGSRKQGSAEVRCDSGVSAALCPVSAAFQHADTAKEACIVVMQAIHSSTVLVTGTGQLFVRGAAAPAAASALTQGRLAAHPGRFCPRCRMAAFVLEGDSGNCAI